MLTSYADGTPAACDVTVSPAWDEDEPRPEIALRTIKTDRNGLAKVTGLMLPKVSAGENRPSLMFRARDNRGGIGTHSERFDFDSERVLRIASEKSLYRDGEGIRTEITSNQMDLTVALDATRDR